VHRPPTSTGRRHRLPAAAAAALLFVLVAVACEPASTPVRITTDPGLFPGFTTAVSDYVSRCDASAPVRVSVSAPQGTTVSVAGQAARSGTFTAQVTRDVGQRFTILVDAPSQDTAHHIRCLPGDFPAFTALRTGRTQSAFYVTVPTVGSYPVIFDENGVPVWWGATKATFFALLLPNGRIAWNDGAKIQEHRFDGSLVRTYSTVGHPFDFHDLLVLPNGNHVVVTLTEKPHSDLSAWGGPSDATIIDHIIQEVTPQGQVVWSWTTSEHISVNETTTAWRNAELADPGGVLLNDYDPYHYNSIESTGDGFLVSFRHLDAVYKINKATGNIVWKMGGTLRPESLAIVGDPVFEPGGGGGFGGQHDARLLGDGTVSLYDNGSARNRPPRQVRYQIDNTARRATLVSSVADQLQPNSFCCGSVRTLPGGNLVFGWGGNATNAADITETTRWGSRLFELSFPGSGAFVYRGLPVLPGVLDKAALRTGMDAQFAG
jgi:hypothetical protein